MLGVIVVSLIVGTCVSFVLFGQITVRKLRKSPATKEQLGLSFMSGWDIINVSTALSLPLWLMKKIENSRLAVLEANRSAIEPYINAFDIFLARVLFICWHVTVLVLLTLGIYDFFFV